MPAVSYEARDIDGNIYHTVTIGTQIWLLENLNVTHYRNGDPIANETSDSVWTTLTTGAWCDYNNFVDTTGAYGKLYNYYAVADPRGMAPVGWHVASTAEWTTLVSYLGGSDVSSPKLREVGNAHWTGANEAATNESGFTALPGGWRDIYGAYSFKGIRTYWWTTSFSFDGLYWSWGLNETDTQVISLMYRPVIGMSVRCVRD